MVFAGDSTFDFSDRDMIGFVQTAAKGQTWKKASIELAGFHYASVPPVSLGGISPPKGGFNVPWTVIQDWVLREGRPNPQNLNTFRITTSAWKEIELSTIVSLAVKDGTDPNKEEIIVKAFSAYHYSGVDDVDAFVEQVLSINPSISPFAFGLVRHFEIKILSDLKSDDSQYQRLYNRIVYLENYSLQLISEISLDSLQPRVKHPNETEVGDPKKAAKEVAQKNKKDSGCENFKTVPFEIARMDTVPESRWQWGWHRVEMGCLICDLYYPQTELRDAVLVAEVYFTVPAGKEFYEVCII